MSIIDCGNIDQLAEFGKNLAALGKALQKPNTRLDKLSVLALRCGMQARFGLLSPMPCTEPTPVMDIQVTTTINETAGDADG